MPTFVVGPSDLAAVEKNPNCTETERRLAACVRADWARIAALELLLAEMRGTLLEAVELEAGPEESSTARDEEEAIDHFVERARGLVEPNAGRATYARWARLVEAAKMAAAGGKPREYYVELAREALLLPAKDGAARGLVKIDLDKAVNLANAIVDPALFDERYFTKREPHPTHTWIDYGHSNVATRMCSGCSIDPEDDAAFEPCTETTPPATKRETPPPEVP